MGIEPTTACLEGRRSTTELRPPAFIPHCSRARGRLRSKAEGIAYGSESITQDNMQINFRRRGRGFYFKDPNGHSLELACQPSGKDSVG